MKNVRVIQGDGVNIHSISAILCEMTIRGWSTDNIAFGAGGSLLQTLNRDVQKFAMKASAICIDGVWSGFSKNPITDQGKKSKEGLVTTDKNSDGEFYTRVVDWKSDSLVTVYELSSEKKPVILKPEFKKIRSLANS